MDCRTSPPPPRDTEKGGVVGRDNQAGCSYKVRVFLDINEEYENWRDKMEVIGWARYPRLSEQEICFISSLGVFNAKCG